MQKAAEWGGKNVRTVKSDITANIKKSLEASQKKMNRAQQILLALFKVPKCRKIA